MALAAECILYKVYESTFACYLRRLKKIRTFRTSCATPTPGAHHQILRQNMEENFLSCSVPFPDPDPYDP